MDRQLADGGANRLAHMMTLEHRFEMSEHEKFVRKLLLGSAEFNLKKSAELGLRMTSPYFSVILVRINMTEDVSISDLPSIIYAIRNIGEELYGAFSECCGVEVDAVTIGFLCNHGKNCGFINEQSADLKRHVVELFGVHTTLSLCTSGKQAINDCHKLYKNARYAMLYRLSFEPYSIINYDDTLKMSRLSCEYPALLEREIFECIQSENRTGLDQAVSAFVSTVDKMSYDTIVLHTTRLLLAVDSLVILDSENDFVHNSIIEELSYLESIDDLVKYIEGRCALVMNAVTKTKSETRKDLIVTNILKYINENYTDASLSVEAIAASVNRSSNYIRSIFKKSQGISISEYINQKRFDQICKMLIETNLTARDIGKEVGLNSGSYFYTSFKKYTGCTPDNYRKIHRAKE